MPEQRPKQYQIEGFIGLLSGFTIGSVLINLFLAHTTPSSPMVGAYVCPSENVMLSHLTDFNHWQDQEKVWLLTNQSITGSAVTDFTGLTLEFEYAALDPSNNILSCRYAMRNSQGDHINSAVATISPDFSEQITAFAGKWDKAGVMCNAEFRSDCTFNMTSYKK